VCFLAGNSLTAADIILFHRYSLSLLETVLALKQYRYR